MEATQPDDRAKATARSHPAVQGSTQPESDQQRGSCTSSMLPPARPTPTWRRLKRMTGDDHSSHDQRKQQQEELKYDIRHNPAWGTSSSGEQEWARVFSMHVERMWRKNLSWEHFKRGWRVFRKQETAENNLNDSRTTAVSLFADALLQRRDERSAYERLTIRVRSSWAKRENRWDALYEWKVHDPAHRILYEGNSCGRLSGRDRERTNRTVTRPQVGRGPDFRRTGKTDSKYDDRWYVFPAMPDRPAHPSEMRHEPEPTAANEKTLDTSNPNAEHGHLQQMSTAADQTTDRSAVADESAAEDPLRQQSDGPPGPPDLGRSPTGLERSQFGQWEKEGQEQRPGLSHFTQQSLDGGEPFPDDHGGPAGDDRVAAHGVTNGLAYERNASDWTNRGTADVHPWDRGPVESLDTLTGNSDSHGAFSFDPFSADMPGSAVFTELAEDPLHCGVPDFLLKPLAGSQVVDTEGDVSFASSPCQSESARGAGLT